MGNFFRIVIISFAIFFFSWFAADQTGINPLQIQSEDIVPTLITPVAIIKDHTLYLDNYYDMMIESYPHPDDKDQERGLTPFYLVEVKEQETVLWPSPGEPNNPSPVTFTQTHYASAFPVITSFLAIPVYFIPVKLGMPITFDNLALLGHITSALIMAFSGGVLYMLMRKHFSLNEKKSLLLTTVFLFGTINYAMFSQGLWQHGTVELFATLALAFLFEKRWFYMSAMLGFAVLARPTAALFIPFFLMLFVYQVLGAQNLRLDKAFKNLFKVENLKKFALVLLGFLPPLIIFLYYTKAYYLGIENNAYSGQFLSGWRSPFPQGFLGMWFSPSKGILIYSPVLIFSCVSLYQIIKNKNVFGEENVKYIVFWAIITIHTLILSIWKHWYGGYGFGYRMAGDIIPFLVLTMIPYMKSQLFDKTKIIFYILLAFSVFMQIHGIIFFDSIWHAAYDDGFKDTGWLWSIKDSELAFNIRRVLVKLEVLERACPQCL